MANKFVLQDHGVKISYTSGGTPGLSALMFEKDGVAKAFKQSDITTTETEFGPLLSVPIQPLTDAGGTRFGFLLPDVPVAMGGSVSITTVGIIETFSGPDRIPRRPATWQCLHLHGLAEEVVVPL